MEDTQKFEIRISTYYPGSPDCDETITVSKEVYDLLQNEFRKKDHAQYMKSYRHQSKNRYSEDSVEGQEKTSSFSFVSSLEDQVLNELDKEKIRWAIQSLTDVQQRRLSLYFIKKMTIREIAVVEKANYNAVRKSIVSAKEKIKFFYR